MRLRTITVFVAAAAALVAACSGSSTVAEVNGERITAAQVDAVNAVAPEGEAIPGMPFRDTLRLLIVNVALRTAAEDQFGLVGLNDADRIDARISDPPAREELVFTTIAEDPLLTRKYAEGAAEFFLIREAVLAELATDVDLDDFALEQLYDAWLEHAVDAAEIHVRSQIGVWGGLDAGVLPPP